MPQEPEERWLPVPLEDYSDYYEVSSLGRVRSLDRYASNGKGYRLVRGRVLKPRRSGSRRESLSVMLSVDQEKRQVLVASLVLEAFVGPRPSPNHRTLYRDRDLTNCALTNLAWAPLQEVWARRDLARGERHGTSTHPEMIHRGSSNSRAKLTEDQVKAIKSQLGRVTQRELARRFNVSQSLIYRIASGLGWAHVEI